MTYKITKVKNILVQCHDGPLQQQQITRSWLLSLTHKHQHTSYMFNITLVLLFFHHTPSSSPDRVSIICNQGVLNLANLVTHHALMHLYKHLRLHNTNISSSSFLSFSSNYQYDAHCIPSLKYCLDTHTESRIICNHQITIHMIPHSFFILWPRLALSRDSLPLSSAIQRSIT